MSYTLLVNPLAEGAFFKETPEICLAELEVIFGVSGTPKHIGGMTFIEVEEDFDPLKIRLLSCIQGAFSRQDGNLMPLHSPDPFILPKRLVYGSRYPGKTHELLTQLAMNVALASSPNEQGGSGRLLDPMAGRGTTLMLAARYGLTADGIELDEEALVGFQREAKKTTKLDRIRHREEKGRLSYLPIEYSGKFSSFTWKGLTTRLIHGDSRFARKYLGKRTTYRWIVSDLPYGIYHGAGGKRNPLDVLKDCMEDWVELLEAGGTMVLAYNAYLPKRKDLEGLLQEAGLSVSEKVFAHRMSESILRHLIIAKKDGEKR